MNGDCRKHTHTHTHTDRETERERERERDRQTETRGYIQPDPAPPSWDCTSVLGDPLEFYSAMSLLVITHHDSYKYAFKFFHFSMWQLFISGNKLVVVRICTRRLS